MITPDDLRPFEIFQGLPEEVLEWVIAHADEVAFEAGEAVIRDGDPADHMYVILDGGVRFRVVRDGQTFEAWPGDVTGILPYSRMETFQADAVTVGPTRVLRMHKEQFPRLVRVTPELGQRLVGVMSTRVREFAKRQQQREKMMALGKLSAGLAHELNNPAAAVRRSVPALRDKIADLKRLAADLTAHGLDPAQVSNAEATCSVDPQARQAAQKLSTLDRSEREDVLVDWLDDHDVGDALVLAETFVDAGFTPEKLEAITHKAPAEATPALLAWTAASLGVEDLLAEVGDAAARISDLVASIKQYSHMDQAPERAPTDIHAGLDSTLKMLEHRFRKQSVRLEKAYADDLPAVEAYGGELNQVWTNLLDNALDAVGEEGEIRVETDFRAGSVYVHIIDSGPGIPQDVQSRIFEPFFTTKGVGEGTGLGLDIVHRIVDQHHGEIRVESEPGRTAFTTCLPAEERN